MADPSLVEIQGLESGGTYSSTIGATYVFTPSFVMDAYYGYSRQDTTSEQPRLEEKIGSELLGIPGTNGPDGWKAAGRDFRLRALPRWGLMRTTCPITGAIPSINTQQTSTGLAALIVCGSAWTLQTAS